MKDPKKLADEKVKIISDYLGKAKMVQDAVPKIQVQLEYAKWEKAALSNSPPFTAEESDWLAESLKEDIKIIRSSLPEISLPDQRMFEASSGVTSTSSAAVYTATTIAQTQQEASLQAWGNEFGSQYEKLHEKSGREEKVKELLSNLRTEFESEFVKSNESYYRAIAGVEQINAAALMMRNLLEHYKGALMNLALSPPRQKLKWNEMADSLFENGSILWKRFCSEGENWGELHGRLSAIAKNLESVDPSTFKQLYTRYIDHLYAVLNLIKIK